MHQSGVQSWLKRRVRQEALGCVLMASVSALASLVVLAVTFAFTFFVLLWCSTRIFAVVELFGGRHHSLYSSVQWLLAASFLFLVLLFVGNTRRSGEHWRPVPRVGLTSNPLAPSTFQAAAMLVADLLYSGPRLVVTALKAFQKSVRLSQLDIKTVSEILVFLAARDSRVSFREICARIPDIDPVRIFPQFRDVDGVVFLTKDPSGLSLTADLRNELRSVLGSVEPVDEQGWSGMPEQDIGAASAFTSGEQCPYRILGIEPSASLEEAKAAYRRLMKEHHPDRVAGLGAEIQALAEERAKAINQAYEEVCAKLQQEQAA